jgi:hypothetical protein
MRGVSEIEDDDESIKSKEVYSKISPNFMPITPVKRRNVEKTKTGFHFNKR